MVWDLVLLATSMIEPCLPENRSSEVNQRQVNQKDVRRKRRNLSAVQLNQDFAKNTTLHGLRYTTGKELTILENSEVNQRQVNRKDVRRKRRNLSAVQLMQDFTKNTTLHGLRYTTEKKLTIVENSEVNHRQVNWKDVRRKRRNLSAVQLMQDFAKNTTLHGLRYTTEKELTIAEKLFWAMTFLISVSLCAVLIQTVWVKWQTSPVIVTLSENLVSVAEVPFPSVTICPQIKAKQSVYNFTREALEIKKMMITDQRPMEELIQDYYINKFEDVGLICWDEISLVSVGERNYSDSAAIQTIMEVSPDISNVFQSCRWREKLVDCSDWFSPVLTTEGVCFTMNSLASSEIFRRENIQKEYHYISSSKPSKDWSLKEGYTSSLDDVYPRKGRGNGLYSDLMLILKEKTTDRDGLCSVLNSGYKIYLQHPADMPQSSFHYYAALPEQSSSFALKLTIMNTSDSLKNYPPEIRQCYFAEERQMKYFRSYTSKNCRMECLSEYTFESCGCVWFHMPHNDSMNICRHLKKHCVLEALERYATEEGRTDSKEGRCQCLPLCVGIQYDAEILNSDFDIKSHLSSADILHPELYHNDTDENNEDLFTRVEFYYKEPRFVSMYRSELFGLTDFLSNCGGLLGLFLGFSFLSLVEIVYFLTLRIVLTTRFVVLTIYFLRLRSYLLLE